jgi:flagellar hook-associated protein 1 FlgK
LGSLSQSTTRLVQNQGVLINQLNTQRESIRGVNLDEEATQLIIFQRIFEGAARVTTVVDSLLDTVINKTGL